MTVVFGNPPAKNNNLGCAPLYRIELIDGGKVRPPPPPRTPHPTTPHPRFLNRFDLAHAAPPGPHNHPQMLRAPQTIVKEHVSPASPMAAEVTLTRKLNPGNTYK